MRGFPQHQVLMNFDDLKSFARSWALESDDCIDHSNADRMNRIDPQLSTVPFTPFVVNRIVDGLCVARRQKFLDCWLLTKRLRAMAPTDIQGRSSNYQVISMVYELVVLF